LWRRKGRKRRKGYECVQYVGGGERGTMRVRDKERRKCASEERRSEGVKE
jgi:hypothetical protein